MLCWRYVGPSGSDLPMKMTSRQSGSRMPEVYHLRPSRTYSSPSRRMVAVMLRASELATAGSVIANAERIRHSSSGRSHRSCCSGVPYIARISMLPGVRGRAVEGLRPDDRPAGQLHQRRVLQVGQPGAPGAVGHEEVPQAELARRRLQVAHHLRLLVRVGGRGDLGVVDRLGGVDVLVHEHLQAGLQVTGPRGGLEVHVSLSSRQARDAADSPVSMSRWMVSGRRSWSGSW